MKSTKTPILIVAFALSLINMAGAEEIPSFSLTWSEYPSWSTFGVADEFKLINGQKGKLGPIEEKWNADIVLKEADYDSCITMYGSLRSDAVCITNMDALRLSLTRQSVAILPTSTRYGADIPGEIIDMVVAAQSSLDKPGGKEFACAVIDTFYAINRRLADPKTADETLIALGEREVVKQTLFYKTPEEALKLFTGEKLPKTMKLVAEFLVRRDITPKEPTIGYGAKAEFPNVDFRFDPSYIKEVNKPEGMEEVKKPEGMSDEEWAKLRAKKVLPYDKGPSTIDVSKYPKEMQEIYKKDFTKRCSKCHTIARAVNAPYALPEEWKRYIKRMMKMPGSGINPRAGRNIYKFLEYDSKTRRKDLFERKLKEKEK